MCNLLLTILDSSQHLYSGLNPAFVEILKIVTVSVGWIGGLTLFLLWKEKHNRVTK